jgi:hypothetical protein
MTAVALTAAQIAPVFPEKAEEFSFVAAATITKGQLVYLTSAGKVDVADGNGSGTTAPIGIAMEAGGAGQAISVLRRGHVYGYTLTSLAYWDPVYMSDTAGSLDTSAGSTSVLCGRVVSLSDSSYTKVLFIDMDWS